MSRVGKVPITLPSGVNVNVDGGQVTVKGPRGELSWMIHPALQVSVEGDVVTVQRASDEREAKSQHGLMRTLVNNMVVGVSEGYQKSLDIVGVGYRATQQGSNVALQVGLSHIVEFEAPGGVELATEGQNRIHVRGIDKGLVGLTAAKIRKVRPPDKYKGKGIRYAGEEVKLKPGKGGKKG